MLTINTLIQRMKKRLPDPIIKSIENEFFFDILMHETLPTFSQYYPKIVKGIAINSAMALEIIDAQGMRNKSTKYIVPIVDEEYPYQGISMLYYPRNYMGGGTYSNPGAIDAFASRVIGAMGVPDVRFTADFESPNIITLNPAPKTHMDFSVAMYKMRRLDEIKNGYHETFKLLFEYDCKIALYYKFYTVVDGGSFGGVELKDFVSPFIDCEDKRTDLLQEFEETYYKDSDRVEEIMQFGYGT